MNPTLNYEPLPSLDYPVTEATLPTPPIPPTIVLQPDGNLDSTNCQEFQQLLETALEQATHGVIIDFLWLGLIDNQGVISLVRGMEKATAMGKLISFQSMNSSTRVAIEAEWNHRRTARYGSWSDRFEADLEQFLEGSVRCLGR